MSNGQKSWILLSVRIITIALFHCWTSSFTITFWWFHFHQVLSAGKSIPEDLFGTHNVHYCCLCYFHFKCWMQKPRLQNILNGDLIMNLRRWCKRLEVKWDIGQFSKPCRLGLQQEIASTILCYVSFACQLLKTCEVLK